ncbi:hypothetical protein UFOVP238_7 [uncultured Caudovirales phage]|uniref:Uncharacterized protein n=1 Tax=uncultured Caudovirales phage TaxID=2100421 RepID=A0A6J7WR53_9CAUD|nr:hypothetical protein UFOVP238_7 [uncultured Caudovirales phage]
MHYDPLVQYELRKCKSLQRASQLMYDQARIKAVLYADHPLVKAQAVDWQESAASVSQQARRSYELAEALSRLMTEGEHGQSQGCLPT